MLIYLEKALFRPYTLRGNKVPPKEQTSTLVDRYKLIPLLLNIIHIDTKFFFFYEVSLCQLMNLKAVT